MISPQFEIIIVASLVAVACSLAGVFLVLRKVSLMSDAISHSVLLGIVIAFFATKSLTSPFLIIGAALTGVLTVSLTELLIKTKKVKEDASIGLVYPFLFAGAVILITKFAENVHIDTHVVLTGEIAFTPFDRVIIGSRDFGPEAWWVMGSVVVLNLLFITLFYKELKLGTFDPGLAATLGFMPGILHYSLMALVSITAVGAFDSVGSVLVVALMIAPPATAYLITERLNRMIIVSIGVGIIAAITGYGAASFFDVSIAGSMATMCGVLFMLAFFFAPHRGLLSKLFLQRSQRWTFAVHMLLVHLLDHEGKTEAAAENRRETVHTHLQWSKQFTERVVAHAKKERAIDENKGILSLTSEGRKTAQTVMTFS